MNAGLARRQRILSPLLFQKIMREGQSFAGRFLVAWVQAGRGRPGEPARKLGVIASKRTFRRAVDRNRARRLLREAFRLNRAALTKDVDVVIVARGKILAVKRPAVETDLRRVMRHLGVMP